MSYNWLSYSHNSKYDYYESWRREIGRTIDTHNRETNCGYEQANAVQQWSIHPICKAATEKQTEGICKQEGHVYHTEDIIRITQVKVDLTVNICPAGSIRVDTHPCEE